VTLHLIKLCVGCDSVKDLEDWIREKLKQRRKRGLSPEHMHRTRMVPKRSEELRDGGSLYWVIRGETKLILVEPRPWRAFQGWRYLAAGDAPRDLDRAAPGATNMPEALRRELRGLGLL